MTVAALFVDRRGVYSKVDDVDLYDAKRDARYYAGPWPVVAHPPCTRWCRLAGLVEARHGLRKGEDDGCFASALASVRLWGGVLEHPAYSDAWAKFGINRPPTGGGWVNADFYGGWTCYVEQFHYGHPAKKATWLYAFGVESLPELNFSVMSDHAARGRVLVSWNRNHTNKNDDRPRIGKKAASATPEPFRDVLLGIARSAKGCIHSERRGDAKKDEEDPKKDAKGTESRGDRSLA